MIFSGCIHQRNQRRSKYHVESQSVFVDQRTILVYSNFCHIFIASFHYFSWYWIVLAKSNCLGSGNIEWKLPKPLILEVKQKVRAPQLLVIITHRTKKRCTCSTTESTVGQNWTRELVCKLWRQLGNNNNLDFFFFSSIFFSNSVHPEDSVNVCT